MTIRLMVAFAFIAVFPCHSSGALAAEDHPSARLTGGSSREWVYRRIIRMMGAGDACSDGETYTFSKDQSLTVQQCVGGRLVATHHKWSVAAVVNGDTALTIDATPPYVLLFRNVANGGHFMRLRTTNKSQTEPVIDKEFELNEE